MDKSKKILSIIALGAAVSFFLSKLSEHKLKKYILVKQVGFTS